MSQLYKYGSLEVELNFLDIDFYEKLENAENELRKKCMNIPQAGRITDRLSVMLRAYDDFFASVFGADAPSKMFVGRNCEHRIDALNLINDLARAENVSFDNKYARFTPQNREQRRNKHGRNNRQRP